MARDFGTVSELYPPGIADLREVPYLWFDAIRKAIVFLSFEENLEKDERPPKAIWLDGDKLAAHFAWVEQRRKERYSGKGDGSSEIDDPVENQAAKGLLVG
jgi:hypothetical protein